MNSNILQGLSYKLLNTEPVSVTNLFSPKPISDGDQTFSEQLVNILGEKISYSRFYFLSKTSDDISEFPPELQNYNLNIDKKNMDALLSFWDLEGIYFANNPDGSSEVVHSDLLLLPIQKSVDEHLSVDFLYVLKPVISVKDSFGYGYHSAKLVSGVYGFLSKIVSDNLFSKSNVTLKKKYFNAKQHLDSLNKASFVLAVEQYTSSDLNIRF